MMVKQAPSSAQQTWISLSIAGLVAALNLSYLFIGTADRELSYQAEQGFQVALWVGALLCTLGAVLGFRGTVQEGGATRLSLAGLLLNVSIILGFLVIHTLKATGFH